MKVWPHHWSSVWHYGRSRAGNLLPKLPPTNWDIEYVIPGPRILLCQTAKRIISGPNMLLGQAVKKHSYPKGGKQFPATTYWARLQKNIFILRVGCNFQPQHFIGPGCKKKIILRPGVTISLFLIFDLFILSFDYGLTQPWLCMAALMHVLVVVFIQLTHWGCTLRSASHLPTCLLTQHESTICI